MCSHHRAQRHAARLDDLEHAKHPKTKKHAQLDAKVLNAKLTDFEARHRIGPVPPPRTRARVRKFVREAPQGPRRRWSKPTCASSSRSPRSTRTRPVLPRSHPGGKHGPDESVEKLSTARLQVLHLRDLVESASHHPLDREPGPHHPHPGPHDRRRSTR